MEELFTLSNLGNLGVLLFLQAVLGFDNLLYISIESQRAPAEQQAMVRRAGILIAAGLRVVLLLVIITLIDTLKDPFFHLDIPGIVRGDFTFSTIVFLAGGAFLMYTAVKEIGHLLALEDVAHGVEHAPKTALQAIALIVTMNLVFSFDSILSAMAITRLFPLLAFAIVMSGVMMLVLADQVAAFIKRNRKYEVLGLFILLVVGIVLLGEGGHEAHLVLFGYEVTPLSKTTFYFSIAVLVIVDVLQSGYQKKLELERARAQTIATAKVEAKGT